MNPSTGFRALVLDQQGRVTPRTIGADSQEQARQIAQGQGQTVLHMGTAADDAGAAPRWSRYRLDAPRSPIDTITFSQDLATLLEAGVTVREGIDTLARKESSAARRRLLHALNASVATGLSLSAALARSGLFPELLVATVAASERTGDLAVGLSRHARHQQNLRSLRDRVIGACVYPLLLLVVGSIIVAILLGIVVPRFSRLLDMQGRELPWMSRVLMTWGEFANANPWVPACLLGGLAAAVLVLVAKLRQPAGRRRWLERIPGAKGVARDFQHLQMYRTAAILTARGITIQNALTHCIELLGPADGVRLKTGLAQIREGAPLSGALSASGLADAVATSMLNVAERSGALPEMLDRIADFYERSLLRNIDIASRLIEPVLMIVFGILIGGIVLLMYLPIFDLASSIN
jgi:general secretion pathway protein F